jgi:hypothetical protein
MNFGRIQHITTPEDPYTTLCGKPSGKIQRSRRAYCYACTVVFQEQRDRYVEDVTTRLQVAKDVLNPSVALINPTVDQEGGIVVYERTRQTQLPANYRLAITPVDFEGTED